VAPLREVTSEQIEDVLAMLNDMGINVVESEETGSRGSEEEADDDEAGGDLVEVSQNPSPKPPRSPSRASAPTIRAHVSAREWARWSCSRARAEIAIAQAHRGRPRAMIGRPVRKP